MKGGPGPGEFFLEMGNSSFLVLKEKGSSHFLGGSEPHMGGRGVAPYPPLIIFSCGGYPPPHVPGKVGITPSPSGPGRAIHGISKKNREPQNPRRRFHAKYRARLCRRGGRMGTRGGGGWPPTPPLSFFQVGGTLPPMCRAGWGATPLHMWGVGILSCYPVRG